MSSGPLWDTNKAPKLKAELMDPKKIEERNPSLGLALLLGMLGLC